VFAPTRSGYRLVVDVIDRVPGLGVRAARVCQEKLDARVTARRHTRETGEDPGDITDWSWSG
jgi:xylulose-5-phosphate/fructose-6-phosphate phosphoketolase